MTDDISWHDSSSGPLAGSYSGKNEILGLFGRMAAVYQDSLRVEVVDVLADGRRAIVLTKESGTVGGEAVAWTCVHHWTFSGRRCISFVVYADGAYDEFWRGRAAAEV